MVTAAGDVQQSNFPFSLGSVGVARPSSMLVISWLSIPSDFLAIITREVRKKNDVKSDKKGL
jgi:hypothetical protein